MGESEEEDKATLMKTFRFIVLICATSAFTYGSKTLSTPNGQTSDLSRLKDSFYKVKRMMSRSVRWGKRSDDLVDELPWRWMKIQKMKDTKSSRPFRMGKRKNSLILLKKSRPLRMGK